MHAVQNAQDLSRFLLSRCDVALLCKCHGSRTSRHEPNAYSTKDICCEQRKMKFESAPGAPVKWQSCVRPLSRAKKTPWRRQRCRQESGMPRQAGAAQSPRPWQQWRGLATSSRGRDSMNRFVSCYDHQSTVHSSLFSTGGNHLSEIGEFSCTVSDRNGNHRCITSKQS